CEREAPLQGDLCLIQKPYNNGGGRGKRASAGIDRRPNGSDVKLQAASTRERTSGAPLAALHTMLTLSVCKRRDAVRLALNQPARPAGAAFGGLSASAASWAAIHIVAPHCALSEHIWICTTSKFVD